MKKSILTIGLLSLVMVLASFTTMETSKVITIKTYAVGSAGAGHVKVDAVGSAGGGHVKVDAVGSAGAGHVKVD